MERSALIEEADVVAELEKEGRPPELSFTIALARLGWAMKQLETVIDAGLAYLGNKQQGEAKPLKTRIELLESEIKARFSEDDYTCEFGEDLDNALEAAQLHEDWTRQYKCDPESITLAQLAELHLSAAHCRTELIEAMREHLPDRPRIDVPPSLECHRAYEQVALWPCPLSDE